MQSTLLSLTFSVALAVVASADGIPFDRTTGRVTEPHEHFKLTKAQRNEYAAQHRLTLTPEQHRRLKVRCASFPAVVEEVLSYRYGDCTCCVGHPYAIMLPGGSEVTVPYSELSFVTRYGVRPRPKFEPPTPAGRPSALSRFWSGIRNASPQ